MEKSFRIYFFTKQVSNDEQKNRGKCLKYEKNA